jgi:hypothetical protein
MQHLIQDAGLLLRLSDRLARTRFFWPNYGAAHAACRPSPLLPSTSSALFIRLVIRFFSLFFQSEQYFFLIINQQQRFLAGLSAQPNDFVVGSLPSPDHRGPVAAAGPCFRSGRAYADADILSRRAVDLSTCIYVCIWADGGRAAMAKATTIPVSSYHHARAPGMLGSPKDKKKLYELSKTVTDLNRSTCGAGIQNFSKIFKIPRHIESLIHS